MSGNVVFAYMVLFSYIINLVWIPLFDVIFYMLHPERIEKRVGIDTECYIVTWLLSPVTFPLMLAIILVNVLFKVMEKIFTPFVWLVNYMLDKHSEHKEN